MSAGVSNHLRINAWSGRLIRLLCSKKKQSPSDRRLFEWRTGVADTRNLWRLATGGCRARAG
jgi:hypothetical protein